jgi:2-dehydropantoate 2-reductase
MRILILGAGGTGGYFGGRLAAAGKDVVFLVRAKRAEQLARDGLVIASPFGDLRQPVRCVTAAGDAGPVDLVVLACKAYDLASAIDAVRPAIGERTLLLPLLNGLQHLATLDAAFGAERVLGGFCHLAVTLTAEGSIRHMNRTHRFALGPRLPAQQEAARAAFAALAGAACDLAWCDDVQREMWEKFCFLTSAAGMTCLARASIGEIMATADGEALMRETFAGCLAVAGAAGIAPDPDWRAKNEAFLTDRNSPLTASMLRDLEKGGRTEAEHVIGDMLQRAQRAGIRIPALQAAYVALQAHERRLAAQQDSASH